jgi:hypothetical protein
MQIIYKTQLYPSAGVQHIMVPKTAALLCLKVQNNVPTLWYSLDMADTELISIAIHKFPTGVKINTNLYELDYVDTCILDEGSYVLHVFKE